MKIKRSGGVNRAVIEKFNGRFALVKPTKEKPIIVHPLNHAGSRGGINSIKHSVTEHEWKPEMCTSRAQMIDMGDWWWALGGGKRSIAIQELEVEYPNADFLKSFQGFGVLSSG